MKNPWPHRAALALAWATLGLIFAGGLVTSTHSGLAVPDWPLSYGRLMPPMVGGILFEHGHRMLASGVGLLTIFTALVFAFREPRPWARRAAWGALALVVLQGVFGGLTVLFRLPKPVSITHACLAQTFLCLTAALAVWTSPAWLGSPRPREEPRESVPLHLIAALLFGDLYLQLVLGAVVRHTGQGVLVHAANAGVVLLLTGWTFQRISLRHGEQAGLWRLAAALASVLFLQIFLGGATYFLLTGKAPAGPSFLPVALITSHVAVGAALLALSLVLALWTYRTRPADESGARQKISDYFQLTKPGISFMTGAMALAGFVLGSRGAWDGRRLLHTLIGTLLVSAGACALNMLLEVEVDGRMRRTSARPLPARRLKPGEALLFGSLLAVAGLLYLSTAVNTLTAFLAGLTLCIYIYLYTPLKKMSALCTAVGAVSGALPMVLGWAAAAGRLGVEAWALFAILFFWQFPHFYALAWLYKDDYARAGLSMLPVVEPDGESTARKVVLNSFALLGASVLPTLLGLTGNIYMGVAFVLGAGFLALGAMFFSTRSTLWARRVFLASVIYLPLLVAAMVLDRRPWL